MNTITILGVNIHRVTTRQAIALVDQRLSRKQKTSIVTVNTEFIVGAQDDLQFKDILNNANIALPDGIGLLWAATFGAYRPYFAWRPVQLVEITLMGVYLGVATILSKTVRKRVIPEQITGVDFSTELARLASQKSYSLFLLGGATGVAGKAAAHLTNSIAPPPKISGVFSGDGSERGDGETVQKLKDQPADIVLVAYGAPKQELWIDRNLDRIPSNIAIGVGGTFMYLSGQVKRAPGWVRGIGLEWLYRLITQPWRWRRQLALPKYIAMVFREKYRNFK